MDAGKAFVARDGGALAEGFGDEFGRERRFVEQVVKVGKAHPKVAHQGAAMFVVSLADGGQRGFTRGVARERECCETVRG